MWNQSAIDRAADETAKLPLPDLRGIRVLVVFGAIPLHGQERGNIEVFRALSELGLQSDFITNAKWGHQVVQPELTRLGLKWTTASFGPLMGRNLFGLDLFRCLYGILNTNWVLWREIGKWRPTHLHVMNWLYFLYATPAILLTRIPVVYRLGDAPPSTKLHKFLWKLVVRRCNFIVCNSNYVRRELLKSGGSRESSAVIYNFPPQRSEPRAGTLSWKRPNNATAIVFVGQIREHKGIVPLIETARHLLAEKHNIVLWIAGDYSWNNPLAEKLIAAISADNLNERIQFLGYVGNVPDLLGAADIHVFPALWEEPSPNVILEAKCAGIPTVAFPNGGVPELIRDGEDGLLCPESTAKSLADTLKIYITNERKRIEAGAAARLNLETRFAYERFQREWAAVFLKTWKHRVRRACR